MNWSLTDAEVREWDNLIRRVARFVAYDFPGLSVEDCVQDVWERMLSQKRALDINHPGSTKILERYAKTSAWAQRASNLLATSQYVYRPSDIRMILETTFFYSEWEGSFAPADSRSSARDLADPLEVRADVTRAFEMLPRNHQTALVARYAYKIVPASSTRERKLLDRAVKRITDVLNTFQHNSGGRRAISNLRAAHIIRSEAGEG